MSSEILDLLRYQIEFSAWANARVLAAASALSADELEHDFTLQSIAFGARLSISIAPTEFGQSG